MALDATVAGASADSYLTVSDADALAAADYGPEREWWLDAGGEDKELALKRATSEIDEWLRSGWARYSSDQALLFPRRIDVAGSPAAAYIPARVGRATYYQAAFLIRNARVIAAADTRRARGAQSVSEPNMSYTQPVDREDAILSTRTLHALQGFRLAAGRRTVRTVRMASGYVP
jgi:hypothetical protein